MAEPTRIDVTERRYGFYKWGLLASLLILIVTAITVVLLLFHKVEALVFLVCFVVVGIGSLMFVEHKRRKAAIRREQSAHEWVRKTLQNQRNNAFEPSAPPQSRTTSWSNWKPWKKGSNASSPLQYETMPPSSNNSATT